MDTIVSTNDNSFDVEECVCLFNTKSSEEAQRALEQLEAEAKEKNLSYVFVSCGHIFSGSLFDPNVSVINPNPKDDENEFELEICNGNEKSELTAESTLESEPEFNFDFDLYE